ncbi:MAG: ABC transporter substrate-binding protein [Fastidiosipilaceae bacterium]|jgi:branched-chain amino acid transport system substrate-binding protein
MKKITSILLSVALVLSLAACGGDSKDSSGDAASSGAEAETSGEINVYVGVEEPLTGANASLGTAEYNAIELCVEMLNEKGGVLGQYPITYETVDTQSDAATGASEVERLITTKGVPVVIGSYGSGIAAAVSEVCERYDTLLWEQSGAADTLLQNGYEWTFRTESMASLWGATSVDYIVDQADYVKEVLGKDIPELKVAIIHEDGSYGTAVGQGNHAAAEKIGMDIVAYEAYSSSTLDLSSVIMKLIAAEPDILLLTGYVNDGSLFLKQSQELGFKVPILITHSGGHSVQAFVDAIGDQVNYLLTVDPVACNPKLDSFDPELQETFKEFEKRWTEKYGVKPAHHVEMRAFAQSYLFFTEVAPKAIEEGGAFTAETCRDAILSLELDASKNLMGSDVKYSTPDEPFIDPTLGGTHVGQNIYAGAFINQYFDGELYCVWPEKYAQKEGVLFLPSSSTLSAGVVD